MPEDEDIESDHGAAAEHATLIAACHSMYDLTWAGAIHVSRHANPRRPPTLPVHITATCLSQMGVYSPIMQIAIRAQPAQSPSPPAQPTPLPALTQQQLQWLEEDLHSELHLPTLPSYHSHTMLETSDHPSIPALDLILNHEDYKEVRTLTPNGPMPGVHPSTGWRRNLDQETSRPIFTEYLMDDDLEIIAPYFQFDMYLDSPELLLTHGCCCSVYSHTLQARKDPYPWPALTHKQRYSFDADQPFSHLVD
jgi:hypothetical protein